MASVSIFHTNVWPVTTSPGRLAQAPMLLILKGRDCPFLLIHSLPSLGTPGFYLLPYHLTTTGPQSSVLGGWTPSDRQKPVRPFS